MLLLSVTMGIPFHDIQGWSSAELSLYMSYYKISPWGEDRADIRNALQMRQIGNYIYGSKSNPTPCDIDDFMPFKQKLPKPDTGVEPVGLRSFFKALVKK